MSAPRLGAIRCEYEHRPPSGDRDPFAVHADAILEELDSGWGGWFGITYDGWWWHASRKGRAGRPLRGLSPDDLITAMRGDLNADGIAPGGIL